MRRAWILAGLFLLHALPFLTRPAVVGGDEPHYLLLAHSIATDGDLTLDDDYDAVESGSAAAGDRFRGKKLDRHLVEYDGRRVFSHPIGLPLILSPFLALQQAIAPGAAPDIPAVLLVLIVTFAALLAGIDLLALRCGDRSAAAIAALAVYFSTPLWFYSRTLFAEPLLWSFAILACWCIARDRWIAASIALALLFAVKEIGVVLIAATLVFAAVRFGTRRALALSVAPLLAFVAWIAKNVAVYGHPLTTAQPWQWGNPLDGATGLLIDGRNGLLVFAPLTLAVAAVVLLRRMRWDAAAVTAAATCLVWFAIAASWVDWRGGSSYGPRLIVPILPLLAIPLVDAWRGLPQPLRAASAILAVAGFALQTAAAAEPFHAFWNGSPVEIIARQPAAALAALLLGSIAALRGARRSSVSTSR